MKVSAFVAESQVRRRGQRAVTVTVPTIPIGTCGLQKYGKTPGCVKVWLYEAPALASGALAQPLSAGEQKRASAVPAVPLTTL